MLNLRLVFDENGKVVDKLYYNSKLVRGVKDAKFDFYSKKKEGTIPAFIIQMDFDYAKEKSVKAIYIIMSKDDADKFVEEVITNGKN